MGWPSRCLRAGQHTSSVACKGTCPIFRKAGAARPLGRQGRRLHCKASAACFFLCTGAPFHAPDPPTTIRFHPALPAARGLMPGYLVKHQSIAIAGVDNLTIRLLLDRQQFFDPLGEA